ncbi:MAG: glucose-1-phosphate adenylyltransferase family protein [Desulfobulbus sp.]|jgi:glucose-1-phosphate adenylyltransferase
MRENSDTLVLLLAGGIGSRLNILVGHRAKPAVPFGGIYRIIDFSLSNVMNSGLRRMGVLTQYKPLSLMSHIGDGSAWDFTGRTRGIKILPPRTGSQDADWYKGTADAIRQNIDFIMANPSDQVVILSGDHIYRMDLKAMLSYHQYKKANITIGMMVVPKKDIHQFGAGIVNNDNRIVDWEEKPKVPRTNLASMGIYVFETSYLLRVLARDRNEVDFGMDIIPRAVQDDRVYAYPFYGYWRDVGTIQAYWEANMDLLRSNSGISPEEWEIRPNQEEGDLPMDRAPVRFLPGCKVESSLISAGCVIEGIVTNSVLSPGVEVRKGAVVNNSIIFDDGIIEEGAVVDLAILDKQVLVGKDAVVGHGENMTTINRKYPKHLYSGISLIGKRARIAPGTMVGRNCIVNTDYDQPDFNGTNSLADGESIGT